MLPAAVELNKLYLSEHLTPPVMAYLVTCSIMRLPRQISRDRLEIYVDHMKNLTRDVKSDVINMFSRELANRGMGYGSEVVQRFVKNFVKEKVEQAEVVVEEPEVDNSHDLALDAMERLLLLATTQKNNDQLKQVHLMISQVLLFDNAEIIKKFEDLVTKDIEKHYNLILLFFYKCAIFSIADQEFSALFCRIFNHILDECSDQIKNCDQYFVKVLSESPLYPPDFLHRLVIYCSESETLDFGFTMIHNLLFGHNLSFNLITALLSLSLNVNQSTRERATRLILEAYSNQIGLEEIDNFVLCLMDELVGSAEVEELVFKINLIFNHLSISHTHFIKFIEVTGCLSEQKYEEIFSQLNNTIIELFYESQQLFDSITNCKESNKNFLVKYLEILDARKSFTQDLVNHIKEYYRLTGDLNFYGLILKYVTSTEIIDEIPSILNHSETMCRNILGKIISQPNHESALSPIDLVIALHRLEDRIEIRSLTKAISACFNHRKVYTQEIMAVILQNLVNSTPIPTLTLRTMIQALTLVPKLAGFVMTLMQKLILKQVWKFPKLWKGFIKCCERTKPQSFGILLQLPIRNLEDCLHVSTDLHLSLQAHVKNMSKQQKSMINKAVMKVLEQEVQINKNVERDVE
ncbi:Symplekin [Thelohanellus kitauei]|uniref:Symplekin n=1 Tax=Thelohanellus kitauei TaxID=669202 RepID=A0A0C2MKG2_THEKT|nr:Symplekin [Thelohanellus kitauei]